MKKLFSLVAIMLCIGILTGCGAAKLSDKYNEETLKASAEAIIKNMDSGDFEAIEATMTDKMKEAVPADKLKEVWGSLSKVGSYEKISKIVFQEKDGYAIVVAIAKFKNGDVQYTLSFDEEMKLVGLYVK